MEKKKEKGKMEKEPGMWEKVKIWFAEEIQERKTSRVSLIHQAVHKLLLEKIVHQHLKKSIVIFFKILTKGHEKEKQFASDQSVV